LRPPPTKPAWRTSYRARFDCSRCCSPETDRLSIRPGHRRHGDGVIASAVEHRADQGERVVAAIPRNGVSDVSAQGFHVPMNLAPLRRRQRRDVSDFLLKRRCGDCRNTCRQREHERQGAPDKSFNLWGLPWWILGIAVRCQLFTRLQHGAVGKVSAEARV